VVGQQSQGVRRVLDIGTAKNEMERAEKEKGKTLE